MSEELSPEEVAAAKCAPVSVLVHAEEGFSKEVAQLVQVVFQHSVQEDHVRAALARLVERASAQVVELYYNPTTKTVTCTNLPELVAFFSDTRVETQSLLASERAATTHRDVRRLLDISTRAVLLLTNMVECQKGYLTLRKVFMNTRTARHLNFCSLLYKSVDEIFRHILQVSLSLILSMRFKGLFLYTVGVMCNVEWYLRQL